MPNQMHPNQRIIGFLSGSVGDGEGRTLEEILPWPDQRLEQVHDFIQWLFPLTEPSPVNPEAPVLDEPTIAAIRAQPALQDAVRRSYLRMRRFYEGAGHWRTAGNHNHLRITRILKCLVLVGLDAEAREFFAWLSEVYAEDRRKASPGISSRSFEFWQRAVTSAGT